MELGIVPIYVWRWWFNVTVTMIITSSSRRSSLTCKHGKIFLFSSHKNKIGVLLLLHLISDRNPHIFNCRKMCRGGKNLVSSCPGVAFATPCHPMATGLFELWQIFVALWFCSRLRYSFALFVVFFFSCFARGRNYSLVSSIFCPHLCLIKSTIFPYPSNLFNGCFAFVELPLNHIN